MTTAAQPASAPPGSSLCSAHIPSSQISAKLLRAVTGRPNMSTVSSSVGVAFFRIFGRSAFVAFVAAANQPGANTIAPGSSLHQSKFHRHSHRLCHGLVDDIQGCCGDREAICVAWRTHIATFTEGHVESIVKLLVLIISAIACETVAGQQAWYTTGLVTDEVLLDDGSLSLFLVSLVTSMSLFLVSLVTSIAVSGDTHNIVCPPTGILFLHAIVPARGMHSLAWQRRHEVLQQGDVGVRGRVSGAREATDAACQGILALISEDSNRVSNMPYLSIADSPDGTHNLDDLPAGLRRSRPPEARSVHDHRLVGCHPQPPADKPGLRDAHQGMRQP
jgi:hypothetical protein